MSLRTLLNRLTSPRSPTLAGTWGAPLVLDRGQVGRPQIAMDDHGNAMAAWHHRGQAEEGVYICRYHAEYRSWDLVPRRLDGARTQAHAPEIAMNVRGEMAVVWQEQEGPQVRICARHMLGAAETWVPHPRTLQALPGEVHSLHTGMDLAGNIHVVWCLGQPGEYRIYTCGYHAEEGAWDAEPRTLGDPSPEPLFPQLAVDRGGQGLVVWSQKGAEPEDHRIVACHYDLGGQCWSDRPTLVAEGHASYLRMTLDGRGNAVVLWVEEGEAGVRALHASHLDGLTIEWTPAPRLTTGSAILWPLVGLDGQGRAHAVWRQESAGTMKLFTKRFVNGRWDDQRTPLVEDLGQSRAHALSVNAQGHALVIWSQIQEAQSSVCLRRFDGAVWSARPILLGAPGRKEIQDPGAALSPGGQVAAIWRQGDAGDAVIVCAVGQA